MRVHRLKRISQLLSASSWVFKRVSGTGALSAAINQELTVESKRHAALLRCRDTALIASALLILG